MIHKEKWPIPLQKEVGEDAHEEDETYSMQVSDTKKLRQAIDNLCMYLTQVPSEPLLAKVQELSSNEVCKSLHLHSSISRAIDSFAIFLCSTHSTSENSSRTCHAWRNSSTRSQFGIGVSHASSADYFLIHAPQHSDQCTPNRNLCV